MILCIVSAAYLVLPNARSHCATLFTLTDLPTTAPPNPKPNGLVHILCKTMCDVPASASEAETGGLFNAGQEEDVPLITALQEMGHPQPLNSSPMKTDNSTAQDILAAKNSHEILQSF